MSRSADYSIKGFLYQFNKSLLEILNSQDDAIITMEGITEDVEIETPHIMTAIQCKYHEASENFTPSAIYKPLLQMMEHFIANSTAQIRYILFAHFPIVKSMPHPIIGRLELQNALDSTNKDLQVYARKLRGNVDIDQFLNRFIMSFGPSYDDLVAQVIAALKDNGFPIDDIETLVYPNAINLIAGISTKHDPTERRTNKRDFVAKLKAIRKTAISRWTLALHSHKQLLDARRKQMKIHLDKNTRLRYLVVDSKSLEDYSAEIVLFVSDYIAKYHYKPAHINTPLLCLCTSKEDFRDVQYRLYTKGIISTDGYIGEQFDTSWFFRDPLTRKAAGSVRTREFTIRLLRWEDHGDVLNNHRCDDLFIIGEPECDSLNTDDMNVERLAAASLKEIKYIMGVSNAYE